MPQTQANASDDQPLSPFPSGVALVGSDGRVEWVNDTLAELLGTAPSELTGQPAEKLLPQDQAAELLRPEWVAAGDKRLLILHDTSAEQALLEENARLRAQNAALKLTDDLTGLPNRRAINQALELQISRSRRYSNPLSVVLVQVGVADEQIGLLRDGAEPLVLAISRFLRDRLRWVDQIGRWDENLFLLVLPETERRHAEQLVEKIRNEFDGLQLPEPLDGLRPRLSFGVGIWEKGRDLRTLMQQAARELAKD